MEVQLKRAFTCNFAEFNWWSHIQCDPRALRHYQTYIVLHEGHAYVLVYQNRLPHNKQLHASCQLLGDFTLQVQLHGPGVNGVSLAHSKLCSPIIDKNAIPLFRVPHIHNEYSKQCINSVHFQYTILHNYYMQGQIQHMLYNSVHFQYTIIITSRTNLAHVVQLVLIEALLLGIVIAHEYS